MDHTVSLDALQNRVRSILAADDEKHRSQKGNHMTQLADLLRTHEELGQDIEVKGLVLQVTKAYGPESREGEYGPWRFMNLEACPVGGAGQSIRIFWIDPPPEIEASHQLDGRRIGIHHGHENGKAHITWNEYKNNRSHQIKAKGSGLRVDMATSGNGNARPEPAPSSGLLEQPTSQLADRNKSADYWRGWVVAWERAGRIVGFYLTDDEDIPAWRIEAAQKMATAAMIAYDRGMWTVQPKTGTTATGSESQAADESTGKAATTPQREPGDDGPEPWGDESVDTADGSVDPIPF